MYTQCPACRTLFRITQEQLDAAGGKVRCGECHQVFHAPDHLHQTIAEKHAAPPPAADHADTAAAREEPVEPGAEEAEVASAAPELPSAPDQPPPAAVAGSHPAATPTAAPEPDDGQTAAASRPPVELSKLAIILAEQEQHPPHGSLRATLLWLIGCLLLLVTLAMQYLYFQRHTLVQQAYWRPLVEMLCQYSGCELPPPRDLNTFTLLEHDIRSHEQYQGALTISATLQNRAAYAQPYPKVEVTMYDLGGNVVAARRFQPVEYLPTALPDGTLLAPQASAQLLLDIVDPGPEAVGFEFTFH